MTNALFDSYKEVLLGGSAPDLTSATVKVALVDHAVVTPDVATHDFYDDISSAVVGTPQTLGSKTITDGVFDAADITFPTVSGASCESLVIYVDTGTPATSRLIAYIDSGVSGLPVTPSGGDINVVWDATGIFAF